MSLILASKFPCTSFQEFFSAFCIISFNKLVNKKWDDERAFNQKFGTLSIPGDFHFGDLVNSAFSSSTVIIIIIIIIIIITIIIIINIIYCRKKL